MQKFKVNGQSVLKIEWKQTDGRMDEGNRITSHANVVNNKNVTIVVCEIQKSCQA